MPYTNGKIRSKDEIIKLFHDGQTIMFGGFGYHGNPNRLIDLIMESGVKHLTTISLDAGILGHDIGILISEGRIDKMITAHIGRHPDAMKMYAAGKLDIEFCPMGTLTERIRCGGMGLGGVLVKTGMGTGIEKDQQIVSTNGEDYILATPLTADLSLIRARRADPYGNLSYRGTNENSNPIVAMNPGLTIVDADMIVEVDEIGIDNIATPGIFVDMVLGH